jgi:hypothetical protein
MAVMALVARSFWRDDYADCTVNLPGGSVVYTAESLRGTMELRVAILPGVNPSRSSALAAIPIRWRLRVFPVGNDPAYPQALWRFAGENAGNGLRGPGPGRVGIFFPAWVAILVNALLPIWRLTWRKAIKPGLCAKCGYDLRATPDRCPECGTVPPKTN